MSLRRLGALVSRFRASQQGTPNDRPANDRPSAGAALSQIVGRGMPRGGRRGKAQGDVTVVPKKG